MAAADIARGNPGNLQWNNRRIQQRHDPANRPDKALRLARAPIHILSPIKAQHFLGQLRRKHLRCGQSLTLQSSANILAFGVGDFNKRGEINASLLRKGLCRLGRRAVFEGHIPRRAGQLFFAVGLVRQQALNQHGQSARRRVSSQLGPGLQQPLAGEQIVDTATQFGLGSGNHAGGNLIHPNFK